MKNKWSMIIYAISHMIIDFACFYIIMGRFTLMITRIDLLALGILIYNVLAFGLQVPIGYIVDNHSNHKKSAMLGCLLVATGVILPFVPWTSLILCALGNAFFHIGGGIDSLIFSGGGASRSGVFVSFGALGVVFGTLAGRNASFPLFVVFTMCLVCFFAIYVICKYDKMPKQIPFRVPTALVKSSQIIIFLCLFSIIIRSYAGFATPLPWRSGMFLFLLPGICGFLGKFSGGMLADKFGWRRIGVTGLLLSIPLLCFLNWSIIACSIGIILFNMTMPVTLCSVAAKLPRNPGLSFGLTTLALLLGDIPIFFFLLPSNFRPYIVLLLISFSAISILLSIPKYKLEGGSLCLKNYKTQYLM